MQVANLDALFSNLESTCQPVIALPNHNTALEHRMLVPRTWLTATSGSLPAAAVGEPSFIGYYHEPLFDSSGGTIEVRMLHVPFEVCLSEWVAYQTRIAGCTIVHQRTDDRCVELCVSEGSRMQWIHAYLDHGRLFTVTSSCARSRWSDLGGLLMLPGLTFELVRPTNIRRHEPWDEAESPKLRAQLPSSWRVSATADHAVVAGLRLGGHVYGLLRLQIHEKGLSREKRVEVLLRSMYDRGMRVDEVERVARTGAELAVRARVRYHGRNLEALAGVVGSVDLVSLGPCAGAAPITCMRVRRCFDISAQTVEVR